MHGFFVEAVFRGLGTPSEKSPPLLSVSVHPKFALNTAVMLVVVGPGPAPSKKFAPSHPTRSTIVASAEGKHGVELPLQPKGVVVLTTATFPPPRAMLMGVVSVMSPGGR